jgi:hypothetical protein
MAAGMGSGGGMAISGAKTRKGKTVKDVMGPDKKVTKKYAQRKK